ncbi:MAG TPA: TetR/AcrR family transcriptional regulator [Thermoleophilaceae bacterium]
MGRPREHADETRVALRLAAERLVATGGPAAFSVRAVAQEAGTTTRAVYTLFGSGDGLLVDALAQAAFEFLADEIDRLVETGDPAEDLVDVGVLVFRRLVTEHPALYRIAFQRIVRNLRPGPELTAARERAFRGLLQKVQRAADAGRLGNKPVREATVEFNAMMEGLANAELRGGVFRNLPEGDEEDAWRQALRSLVHGFAVAPAA